MCVQAEGKEGEMRDTFLKCLFSPLLVSSQSPFLCLFLLLILSPKKRKMHRFRGLNEEIFERRPITTARGRNGQLTFVIKSKDSATSEMEVDDNIHLESVPEPLPGIHEMKAAAAGVKRRRAEGKGRTRSKTATTAQTNNEVSNEPPIDKLVLITRPRLRPAPPTKPVATVEPYTSDQGLEPEVIVWKVFLEPAKRLIQRIPGGEFKVSDLRISFPRDLSKTLTPLLLPTRPEWTYTLYDDDTGEWVTPTDAQIVAAYAHLLVGILHAPDTLAHYDLICRLESNCWGTNYIDKRSVLISSFPLLPPTLRRPILELTCKTMGLQYPSNSLEILIHILTAWWKRHDCNLTLKQVLAEKLPHPE